MSREEIRKQVDSIIQQATDKGKTPEQITDLIFVYQHLQGVVRKVDRELPQFKFSKVDKTGYMDLTELIGSHYKEAGYEAVESLI